MTDFKLRPAAYGTAHTRYCLAIYGHCYILKAAISFLISVFTLLYKNLLSVPACIFCKTPWNTAYHDITPLKFLLFSFFSMLCLTLLKEKEVLLCPRIKITREGNVTPEQKQVLINWAANLSTHVPGKNKRDYCRYRTMILIIGASRYFCYIDPEKKQLKDAF